jgi:anti-anti-sigma factor
MRILTDRLSVHVDDTDMFSVRVDDSNGATHLRLSGRFDASALHALDDAISAVPHRDVVLDLAALTFMDGAAWIAVTRLENRVQDWGNELRLVNAQGRIRTIFELTGTEHLLSEAVGG